MSENDRLLKNTVSYFDDLEKLLKESCIATHILEECQTFLNGAKEAGLAGNIDGLVNQVDLFVLAIKRNMGTEISLRVAARLVDIVILDIKRPLAHPAQMYNEMLDFSYRFSAIQSSSINQLDMPSRPLPEGVEQTGIKIKEMIQSYHLPTDTQTKLLDMTEQMVKIAMTDKPEFHQIGVKPEQTKQFLEIFVEFYGTLIVLEGSLITSTQVSSLLGIILLGWPTWLCINPKIFIARLILIAALALFKWIAGKVDDERVKAAIRNIITWMTGKTSITSGELKAKLKEEADKLDEEQKKKFRKALEDMKNQEPFKSNKELKDALQEVIDELPADVSS